MPASIKKVITASASITVARIITTLCSFITVPLILNTLGKEEYGLWILLMSLTGYFGLSNLGITYSLKNKVAYLFAESKHNEINNFISACFLFYSFLFILILGIVYLLIYTDLFPFHFLLSQNMVFIDKAKVVFTIIITFYLFNLFVAGVINNTFHGLQEISRLNIVGAIYSVISSVIFICFLLTRPSLIGIAFFQGFSNIVLITILYGILKRKFNWLKISIRISNLKYMKAIKTSSFYFLVLSIFATIITSIDNIVISHYVGVSSVFIYAILFKLFQIPSGALPIATASWPLISSLHQKKEYSELRNFYFKVLRLNVLSKVPLFVVAAIFSKEIISFWVGSDVFYGYALVIIFLLTWTLWIWTGSNMVFINAMSLHKLMLLPSFLEATINLTISILLVKYTSFGIVGVALGTLIGQMLVSVYYVPIILSRELDIKPFKEISKIIIPLLIPSVLLFGLKMLINSFFIVTIVEYGLYLMSAVFYFMVLYLVVLEISERQMIKEKIMNIPDGVIKWRNKRR